MNETPLVNEPVPSVMPPGRNSFPGDSGFQMDGTLRRMVEGKGNPEIVDSKVEASLPVTHLAKVGLLSPRDMSDAEFASLPLEIRLQFPRVSEAAAAQLVIPGEDPLEAQMRNLQAQLEAKRAAKLQAQLAIVPSQTAPPAALSEIKRLAGEIIIETATADNDAIRSACRELAVAILTQCR